MFCPSCGTETREALKFCKQCGANLRRVQGVMGKGGAASPNWNQMWLEEREEERERKKRKLPEEKRLEEIKTGVITTSVGVAVTIFFSFLFEAIANTADGPGASIIRSLWAVGLVPTLVGLGFIFNGVVVSKRLVELKKQQDAKIPQPMFAAVPATSPVPQLNQAAAPPISDFSIAEPTTARLREPIPIAQSRDTN
ncbi:MAG: hypothetical protein ACKVZH_16920 [Blastocatellia bacterium]